MPPRNAQRLELTWFNKDKALIPAERGKYGYAWVDPRDPRYCEVHTLVETETVTGTQADKVEGVNYSDRADFTPTTDNLLIRGDSGDVLEALHHVPELAEKYAGEVKCCYLDSPFNTEKTFNHYEDNLEHSIWLTMMRDRMLHVRDLLSPDGSVWVHLDSSENHRMRLLMDEVFGPNKFVAEVVWQKRYSRESRPAIGIVHDTIMVYAPNPERWKSVRHKVPRTGSKEYRNPDNDPRGPWRLVPMTAPGTRKNQMYDIVGPDGTVHRPPAGRCWSTVREGFDALMAEGKIRFGMEGRSAPGIVRYLDEDDGLTPWSWWPHDEVGHTDESKKEIQALFPGIEAFDTPKPERLLERIIHIATDPGDLVLDVFAGSGTTAAVAHKMGRRWITSELRAETIETFTLPRLTKVVRGEDLGGASATVGERVDDTEFELPGNMTADEAQKFNSLLTKVVKDHEDLKKAPAIKELKALTKTRKASTLHWRGGGSFRVMELSPTVFDFDPQLELVMLTDAAHGKTLIASIAANLGFYRTPDAHPFHGRKGKMRLVVMEGAVTEQVVDDVLAHLPAGERVTIAALSVPDGVRKYLRQRSRGSVIKHVPDDLFSFAGDLSTASSEG